MREDVGRGFLPTPGGVTAFEPPSGPGVRLDTGVQAGSIVPGTFDSLMAKLIVSGATREQAIARARRALREFRIGGVASVLPFHRAVMEHPDFTNGEALRVHTRWIETDFAGPLAAAARAEPPADTALVRTAIEIDGRRVALGLPALLLQGLQAGPGAQPAGALAQAATPGGTGEEGAVPAPVAGTVQAWKVTEGDTVAEGDVVAVMEAMKMEMQVTAPRAGRIAGLVAVGSYQAAGAPLARVRLDG